MERLRNRKHFLKFGSVAAMAAVAVGMADPDMNLASVAGITKDLVTDPDIAKGIIASQLHEVWSELCDKLTDSDWASTAPLSAAMARAYVSAINTIQQSTGADARMIAYFDALRLDAGSVFADVEDETYKPSIQVWIAEGVESAADMFAAYLTDLGEADFADLTPAVLPIVRKQFPSAFARALYVELWSSSPEGTAAHREYDEIILRSISSKVDKTREELSALLNERFGSIEAKMDEHHAELVEQHTETQEKLTIIEGGVNTLLATNGHLKSAPEGFVTNIPIANPHFAGRETDLDDIRRHFDDHTKPMALIQAIQGLGGVGKTQLALQYAHLNAKHYNGGIWLIRAEQPETLASDYAQLGKALHLPTSTSENFDDQLPAVRNHLNNSERHWLLIFDNADPHGGKTMLNSVVPTRGNCDVLITSRIKDWSHIAIEHKVDVWPPETATDFLLNRTQQTDADAAEELAETLHYLPLALEQAAAFIVERQGEVSLADYLELFRTHSARLLSDEAPAKTGDYEQVVATTWNISIKSIAEESPAAVQLLQLFAFYAPERIPYDLIARNADFLPDQLREALTDLIMAHSVAPMLAKYSMIEPLPGREYSVHRLVQLVVRDQLSLDDRAMWITAALRILDREYPDQAQEHKHWIVADKLMPHAQDLSSYANEMNLEPELSASIMRRVGRTLYGHGEYNLALEVFSSVLEVHERILDPKSPDLAMTMNDLGIALHAHGDPDAERTFHEQSLASRKAIYGESANHPDIAVNLRNLAMLDLNEGNIPQARQGAKASLRINQAINHRPDEAQSFELLASVARRSGNAGGYRRLLMIAYLIQRDVNEEKAARLKNRILQSGSYAQRQSFERDIAKVAKQYERDRGNRIVDESLR